MGFFGQVWVTLSSDSETIIISTRKPWLTHSAANKSLDICFFYNLISQASRFDCTLNLHWVRKRSLTQYCPLHWVHYCALLREHVSLFLIGPFQRIFHYAGSYSEASQHFFTCKEHKPIHMNEQHSFPPVIRQVRAWEMRNSLCVCVCCRKELGVFMDDDKSCQTFPAKLLLPFTPSTNKNLTKPPGDIAGEADRLLPRAKHRKRILKIPDLANVNLLIFMYMRSCVIIYFLRLCFCVFDVKTWAIFHLINIYSLMLNPSSKIILHRYGMLSYGKVCCLLLAGKLSIGLQMLEIFHLPGSADWLD